MAPILVVGYGNPLRGDDAFGRVAAERLRDVLTSPKVEILSLHQLTPELMQDLSRVSLAIFIDAAASGEPGAVSRRRLRAVAPARGAFVHHATAEALLAGAARVYGHAPEAVMISVAGSNFDCSDGLSPAVAAQVEPVVALALQLIEEA